MRPPRLPDTVLYRGKEGYQAMRSAMVTGTVASLDPRGVEGGHVQALDSDEHVHLWVFTPGSSGGFPEFNVPHGSPEDGSIPPGSWCWADELYGSTAVPPVRQYAPAPPVPPLSNGAPGDYAD